MTFVSKIFEAVLLRLSSVRLAGGGGRPVRPLAFGIGFTISDGTFNCFEGFLKHSQRRDNTRTFVEVNLRRLFNCRGDDATRCLNIDEVPISMLSLFSNMMARVWNVCFINDVGFLFNAEGFGNVIIWPNQTRR